MWQEISQIKDYSGQFMFVNISELAKKVFTLPHSNAACERIFSMVTDIKTKKRNCMTNKRLNSSVVIRSALKAKQEKCSNFVITIKHLYLYCKNMYSKNDSDKTSKNINDGNDVPSDDSNYESANG